MTIWALGSNGSGQLGIGSKDDTDEPRAVLLPAKFGTSEIRKIVAGGNHTLFLFAPYGRLLATGDNEDGRCGDSETDDASVDTPQVKHITLEDGSTVEDFFDVSATWTASFFVASDRQRIFVRGTGLSGELGLGKGITKADSSSVITMPSRIKSIVSCLAHTVVVLINGDVWGWGKGRKGQLQAHLDDTPYENLWAPTKIDVSFEVDKAVCGADFSCFLAHPRDGDIKLIGAGTADRHGLRAECPETVRGWTDAVATWGSVTVKTPQRLYSWGRDERGQRISSHMGPFRSLAAGSEHWLLLAYEGDVYVGGWGEHGNCGVLPKEVDVAKGGNQLLTVRGKLMDETPKQIFAGCATSFIIT